MQAQSVFRAVPLRDLKVAITSWQAANLQLRFVYAFLVASICHNPC